MYPFRKIDAWQRSHQAALRTYQLTKSFPREELFGLTAQLRRAAFSVPANIAEGSKRQTQKDFARSINIAEGSAAEAGYLFEAVRDLQLLAVEEAGRSMADYEEICRMLYAFRCQLLRGG